MEALLQSVINTLETVEVHGSKNLDAMLGCINALKSLAEALNAPPEPPEPTELHERKDEVDDG